MKHHLILMLALLLTTGCGDRKSNGRISENFDIQGHRGCRGTMPENSIVGFIQAAGNGVTTIEMDVVITKDKRVILSHEPYISHSICLDSTGMEIPRAEEKNYNIYQMTYDQVVRFDCGSKAVGGFPAQKKMDVRKPPLMAVIQAVENFIKSKGLPQVQYNIETKSSDLGDDVYHPRPEEFVSLLLKDISMGGIEARTIIQSFDPRTLNAVHDLKPEMRTALLVTNQLGYRHNLQRLDFKPTIFSPNKIFLTSGMIDFMHEEGIQVIPWTVNKKERMQELIEMGVDGIITDYPTLLIEVLDAMEGE